MLGTFVRLYNFGSIYNNLCFFSLLNFLCWSFYGVEAGPVRWGIGVSSEGIEVSPSDPCQPYAVIERLGLHHHHEFIEHVYLSHHMHDATTTASVSTGAMATVSCSSLSASASSTSWNLSFSASSTSMVYTSSSTSLVSSPSQTEVGGSSVVETSSHTSSPTPAVMASLTSPETPTVTSKYIPSATPVSPVATSIEGTASPPAVTTQAVDQPTVPLASPETLTVIPPSSPPAVPAPSVVAHSDGSSAATGPSAAAGTSVSSTSLAPSPTPSPSSTHAISASSADVQSYSSSQATPSALPVHNAVSTRKLSASLIATITVLSFLGLLSLALGVIVFLRIRRNRMAQRQRLPDIETQPSRVQSQNLSSRFSVSTVGSVGGRFRFPTLLTFGSRAPT